jgi:hypothetical protein
VVSLGVHARPAKEFPKVMVADGSTNALIFDFESIPGYGFYYENAKRPTRDSFVTLGTPPLATGLLGVACGGHPFA